MKNDYELLSKIKKEFNEAPELPKNLSKEKMVQMLKDKNITPKKKIRLLPKIASVAAVLAVTLACLYVFDNQPVRLEDATYPSEVLKQEVATEPTIKYPVIESGLAEVTLKKAESNAQLKKHIKDLFEDGRYNLYGYVFNSTVGDDIKDGDFGNMSPTMALGAESIVTGSASDSVEYAVDISLKKDFGKTNTQVEGIEEADIVKNDGRYLYIVSSGQKTETRLKIVDTQTMTVLYDKYILSEGEENLAMGIYDIYVNGNTLVALCSFSEHNHQTTAGDSFYYCYGYDPSTSQTVTVVFDISDKANPKELRRVNQDGRRVSSRMNGSVLYTVSTYTVYGDKVDEKYMPTVNGAFIGCDCVYIYDDKSATYTLLTAFDTSDKNSEVSSASILGSGMEVYCTKDTLYVGAHDYKDDDGEKTNIFAFALDGAKVTYKASGSVKGGFLNQFSFDEYKNCLRIATTLYDYKTDKDVSSVYVLDKELNLIGKLENIADDEQVKSVRFMGDTGYIVTFRNTDPLFTLDLSDPTKPQIIGEVKLPGYSSYLHPIGNGYVVGIGYDGDEETADLNSVKVSVFDVNDLRNPKETDTFVIKNAQTDVNNDPKAFICSERGFIGIPVKHYEYDEVGVCKNQILSYKILKIENGKIISHEGFNHADENGNRYGYTLFRGTYIGEKLYTINLNKVVEHSLTSGETLRSCNILGSYDKTENTSQTAPVSYGDAVVWS